VTGRKLLEKFEDFSYGEEFADLAAHIVHIVTWEDAHPDWDPTSDEEYQPHTPEEKPEKAATE
jgi:hypothetical protein